MIYVQLKILAYLKYLIHLSTICSKNPQ